MTTIVIEVKGQEGVASNLKRLSAGLNNLTSPMSEIGRYLTGFFSGEMFASRGGVVGESWAPLDDRYAAYKARTFPGRPPLIRRGTMNRSFKANAGRASVLLYNSDPKFDYHQLGTKHIPARTMMAIDQTRTRRIVDIIEGHLEKLTRAT